MGACQKLITVDKEHQGPRNKKGFSSYIWKRKMNVEGTGGNNDIMLSNDGDKAKLPK